MIWGYHYFRKHPYIYIYMHMYIHIYILCCNAFNLALLWGRRGLGLQSGKRLRGYSRSELYTVEIQRDIQSWHQEIWEMLSGCFEKSTVSIVYPMQYECIVYLPTYIWLICMVNVGQYDMDATGMFMYVHPSKTRRIGLSWVVIEPVPSRPQQLQVYQSWRQGEIAVSQGDAGALAETSKVPRLRNSGDLLFGEWGMKSYPGVGVLFIGTLTEYAFKTFVVFLFFCLPGFLRKVLAGCMCPVIWKGGFPTWCLAGGYVG